MTRPATPLGQVVRFGLIGIVNTFVGYGIYALLLLVGLPPQPALAIAFALGVAWNFMTHAKFVFAANRGRFPAYCLAYLFLYGLNALCLAMATRMGIDPYIAQAVLAVLVAGLSFFLIGYVLTGSLPLLHPKGDR